MKVRELIALLEEEGPEADVHFAYNYGDHSRTIVAPKVNHVTEVAVTYSGYHRVDRLAVDEQACSPAVVLSDQRLPV